MSPACLVDLVLKHGSTFEVVGDRLLLHGRKRLPPDLLNVVRSRARVLRGWLQEQQRRNEPTTEPNAWPNHSTPTPEQWTSHRETIFQEEMTEAIGRHGLTRMVSTGPASAEEIEEARAAFGFPATHEEWVRAVKASRKKLK